MDIIELTTNNIKEYIEIMLKNNSNIIIDKNFDIINYIIDLLFNKSKDKRIIFLRVIFVFLMFYTEFINPEIQEETNKIYLYLNFKDINSKIYKINYNLLDSIYVIIASLIESDLKDLINDNNNFIKLFDNTLTKNIKKLQNDERVNYDPYKTPVICDIISFVIPVFDSINLYDKIK